MNNESETKIEDKIIKLVWIVLCVLIAIFSIIGTVKEHTKWLDPDYSQPHEYLSVTGYGINGESLEGNDHKYTGIGLLDYRDNFFPIGEGKCSEYLERITQEDVATSISGFNYFLLVEEDYDDIRVGQVKLQCMSFLGIDRTCQKHFKRLAAESKDPAASLMLTLDSGIKCRSKAQIGEPKFITMANPG